MRDPDRIPPVIDRLWKAWEQHPDMRLTQLVLNACAGRTARWPDVWEVEDDELLRGLEALIDARTKEG